MSTEVKVGIIFLVGLLICGAFTIIIGGLDWLVRGKHTLHVIFDNVYGLKEGNIVRVLGLTFGKVQEIKLQDGQVFVTLSMDDEVALFEDYRIYVREESMVGGRYVSIHPGTPGTKRIDTSKPLMGRAPLGALDATSEILHEHRDRISDIVNTLEEITRQVKEGKGTLGKLVKDDSLYNRADEFLSQCQTVIEDLKRTTERIQKGEGSAGKFLQDEELYNNLKEASERVKDLFDKLDRGEGTLGQLLKDKTLYEDMKKSAEEVRHFTEKLNSEKGLISALAADEVLRDDVKIAVANIKESAASLNRLLKEVEEGKGTLGKLIKEEEFYEKASEAMESVEEVAGKVARTKTFLGMQTKSYFESEMSIHKVSLRIVPSENKYFMAAASFMSLDHEGEVTFEDQVHGEDAIEIRADILLAYRFFDNHLTLRAGMMESKLGAGFDVDFLCPVINYPVRFSLEGRDAYNDLIDEDIDENIDGPLIRSEISIPLFHHFRLHLGASNILDDPEALAGLTFEFEEEDISTLVALLGLSR